MTRRNGAGLCILQVVDIGDQRPIEIELALVPKRKSGVGGSLFAEARRLKDLEQENARLKRVVADLSLDNLILKEVSTGKF